MAQNINWTPLFFPSNRRCIAEFEILSDKLEVQLKSDLKKEIYTQNKIQEKEISIVEYLSKLKKLEEEVLTPESDIYVTPESSPTDVCYCFGHTRCASDSGLSSLADSSDSKYLHTTNTLYYSLVTVDEVYTSDSPDILEKELAEQDQLLNSFKSIISRESNSCKNEAKQYALQKPIYAQSVKQSALLKTYKSSKGLDLKLSVKSNLKEKCGFKITENLIKSQPFKNVGVSNNFEKNLTNKAIAFQVNPKVTNGVHNCEKCRFYNDTKLCETITMSKTKIETDEIMEAESYGPDSCLEAGSSGYLTGSSPRDHTVSEAYGGDLTEVATSEDIPHDNDQSARSSSMSSDAGTWDSTFPPVAEGILKDHLDENIKRTVELGDHDCNINITNSEKLCTEPFVNFYSTNQVKSAQYTRTYPEFDQSKTQCILSCNLPKGSMTDNYMSPQNEVYLPENEYTSDPLPNSIDEVHLDKEHRLCGGKANFFINAASLLDENEVSSIPPNSLSCNDQEFPKVNFLTSWSEVDKTHLENFEMQKNDEQIDVSAQRNHQANSENVSAVEKSDLERRRGSLIRRNTFELELDDERLAVLRQECERHKDKILHQNNANNSYSSNHEGIYDKETSLVEEKLENNCINGLNSLPTALNTFGFSQKNEDEVHSPDSLNNDGPFENCFGKSLKKGTSSYKSLPSEVNGDSEGMRKNDNIKSIGFENTNDVKSQDTCSSIDSKYQEGTCDSNVSSGFSSTNNIHKMTTQIVDKTESTPIVSGGVSLKDLTSPNKINVVGFSSPLMNRRKTEYAPIISGGTVLEVEPEQEPKPRLSSSFASSWVVDMSQTSSSLPDTDKNKINDTSSSLSSCSSLRCDELQRPTKTNNSSLGFFIPLDDPCDGKSCGDSGYKSSTFQVSRDIDNSKTSKVDTSSSCNNQSNSSSSCGFYVDLNDTPEFTKKSVGKETHPPDKKLFSMFIDIGDSESHEGVKSKTNSPHIFKKRNHTRTYSGVFPSKRDEKGKFTDAQMSSESSLELTDSSEISKQKKTEDKDPATMPIKHISSTPSCPTKTYEKVKKPGFYMFIESEVSPVTQRRTLPSGLQPSSQRHSWNSESHNFNSTVVGVSDSVSVPRKSHRRSHSVSVNKSLEVMFNVEQIENKSSSVSPLVKVSTSNSIGYESGPSSIDDTASKYSNKSMLASWHGSVKPSSEFQKVVSKSDWKESKENKSISVKTPLDPKSDAVEEMCESVDKSDEVALVSSKGDDFSIASNESSNTGGIHNSTFVMSDVSNVANASSNELEITTPTCDVVSLLSKDDSDKTETDFDEVIEKRSDDMPRTPDHSMSQIPITEHKFTFVKLSDMDKEPKKIPVENKNFINRMSRSIPEASWIENKMMTRSATSRSLSRLFPHLNTSARNITPDSADHDTDFSEVSSMQSSIDPSALDGSTEETDASSCTGGPVSRLGEDLLRMFLDEISPDVTVEVGGRRIKAHKCILSSRCQYFAAILSGGWVESAGNVISLQGFSYSAVHFALCHIYSGASNIPDSINIVELATLADMLCLEGLKEVIMYTLKVKYCHFFHKPCPMCTVGVLECLPLAAAYGLDEIYRKSLRWITKYFVRVWPTKGFATLPRELLDKCYKQHIVHMTVDNVLETVLCCNKLQGLIPNVRWAEPVFALASKLYDAAVKFIAQHFCEILSSEVFMSLGKEQLWTMSHLEETLLSAAEKLPPDQACKCHSHLYKLTTVIRSPSSPLDFKLNDGFLEFLHLLSTTIESCLLKQAARASRTPAWTLMEPHLRHKIQDAACLVIVPGDDRRRARHLLKRGEAAVTGKRPSDLLPTKTVANDSPTMKKLTPPARPSVPASIKPKTPQVPIKTESTGPRPKTWPYKISEVKSRYLEPKATPKQSPALSVTKQDKTTLTPTARRNVSKSIISSSDSSRTSSPAMRRSLAQRPSRSLPNKDSASCPKREDNLTMSTDSLMDPVLNSSKKNVERGNRNQPFSRIDSADKNTRPFSVKSHTVKDSAAEAVARLTSADSKVKAATVLRVENDKPKYSPVAVSKKNSSHSSPRVKDSPVTQGKSTVNSTPSPSIRRSTLSPKEKSHSTADTKSSLLKRTSTYRVQGKSSSPLKVSTIKPKEQVVVPSLTKGNINKIQSKVSSSKKSVANNNVVTNNHKTETKPQPMVGSRSGTFLKDEPTVLKKPQVVNVSE